MGGITAHTVHLIFVMPSLPTLAELITDPKYDFLSQFSSESDDISNYEIFNEANDNPYESLQISCDYYDENEYSLKYRNRKNFSMLSLNIQSLLAKFNEFRELLSHFDSAACSPDIIFIQETWKKFYPTHFSLHNYSPLEFICRDNRQGGGVGLYFKSGLQYKIIKEKSLFLDFIIETIVAEVILPNNKKMAVVSIYRLVTQLYHIQISLNSLWIYLLILLAICKIVIMMYIFWVI